MDFLQFDTEIARLLGRYLGGVYSAEAFAQRFFTLHSRVASSGGGQGRPTTQRWTDSFGDATTFPSVVFADLEDFAAQYTNGPSPEYQTSVDPNEIDEVELDRRISKVWLPQINLVYGPSFVHVEKPDLHYVARQINLASNLIDIHRKYLDGESDGVGFIDAIYAFRSWRDREDVHHYQFDAAIWEAGVLEGAVIDAARDQFTYDGRAAAERRLEAILDAFPELR